MLGILLLSLICTIVSVSGFGIPTSLVITGASGYLGREIVHSILDNDVLQDSNIVCLVRTHRIEDECKYWGDNKAVKVMSYDMLDGGKTVEDALSTVFQNENEKCCILHVASVFTPTEEHEQMALDNVKGAEDLMIAVAKFPVEKTRVILTSSMAGVRGSGQIPENGKFYTEKDWNTKSELGANWGASYQWSKATSEQRAWDIAKEKNINFTGLCPSFIFGPPSDAKSSESFSISTVRKWVFGEGPVQSRLCVDVRDVALAHVQAAIRDCTINERIIVSTEARIPSQKMAEELKKMSTEMGIGAPDKIYADTEFSGGAIQIGDKEVGCYERMESLLDLKPRSVEETMSDMAKVLLELEK